MKEMQKILACIDLSEYTKSTMEYAVALARGMMTDVVILNVINERDVEAARSISLDYPERINIDEYVERTRAHRKNQINKMIQADFKADIAKFRIIVEVGVPFKTILETIKKEDIDMVVLGNKGRSNVVGTLFGSHAEKVFRHSPVPVLSVRTHERFSR